MGTWWTGARNTKMSSNVQHSFVPQRTAQPKMPTVPRGKIVAQNQSAISEIASSYVSIKTNDILSIHVKLCIKFIEFLSVDHIVYKSQRVCRQDREASSSVLFSFTLRY